MKTHIQKVYEKTEVRAQDTLDYNWLAYSISEVLRDKSWARTVFKKSFLHCKVALKKAKSRYNYQKKMSKSFFVRKCTYNIM